MAWLAVVSVGKDQDGGPPKGATSMEPRKKLKSTAGKALDEARQYLQLVVES